MNDFQINGASPARQSRFSPIWNCYFSSGLISQRNPLRPGNASALTTKMYGNRGDSLLDGLNLEISNRLTFVRRPGTSVYNSRPFPPINSFYEFRVFDATDESIKVMADTRFAIYDATGPSTQRNIWTKIAGAGDAYFQSVGNTLFFGDGLEQKKWVQSAKQWTPNTVFAVGTFIVDPNNDIQVVQTGGTSGPTQPTWNTFLTGTTIDGTVTWVCRGSAVQDWGIVAPSNAPIVTQVPIGSSVPNWAANMYQTTTGGEVPTQVVILDGSGNIQQIQSVLGPPAHTGASTPAFSGTIGGTVVDGNITWINQGPSTWIASHLYNIGNVLQAVVGSQNYFFRCATAGTSGTSTPSWTAALNFTTNDGTVVWENIGVTQHWSDIGPTTVIGTGAVLDSNGSVERILVSGVSGSSAPTWSTILGGSTTDGTITWTNMGPATGSTSPWTYVYSYKNSITGGVSTASPISAAITLGTNNEVIVQGIGSSDNQVDTIVIFRTVQGGSVFLELAEIPNPGAGLNWTYTDTTPDTGLNNLIVAPIADSNDPPPVGLTKMTYHLNRIWGVVNNSVYFSGGPDTTTGNGAEAFPPANVFVFPDQVNRLFASSQGLFVFTVSDIYVIQGTTTTSFFSVPFCLGLGLPNYNAFSVNGSTPYFFTSDEQVVALDMTGGVVEVGFNIGDQFQKPNWNPTTVRATYHISGSTDKGLYVSDFSTGWFRLYPTPAPENGQTWTPFAGIIGGCSTVQSVQTSSGHRDLLIGPQFSGPILKRDNTVFTDNGQPYDAFGLLGSIVVAQPGQLAEILFLTFDSVAIGNRPTVSVQLDEIAPFSAGLFETLPNFVPDPTELTPSVSMFSDRYYLSQTQQPALGRSIQIHLDWGNDTVQNELLSMTLFGGYSSEL